MKRLLSVLFIMGLFICIPYTSSAYEINNYTINVSYEMLPDWHLTANDKIVSLVHKDNTDEGINIGSIKNDGAYVFEYANKEILYDLCRETFSDSFLSKYWSDRENTDIIAETVGEKVSYETYNNTRYYRYEKKFTVKREDTVSEFYATVFATTKNGRIYFVKYMRDESEGHFDDVVSFINSISYKLGDIVVEYNGEIIEFDCSPVMINGRTMVPYRVIAEKMGYTVEWIPDKKTVVMSSDGNGTVYKFTINNNIAMKNHIQQIELHVPPMLIDNSTYLPVRAVAETMGAQVNWIGEENKVQIIKNNL